MSEQLPTNIRAEMTMKLSGVIYDPPSAIERSVREFYLPSESMRNKEFVKYIGKSGIWLVADNIPNKADWIYFRSHEAAKSQGFGGTSIDFNMKDGSVVTLQGPWHGNAEHLYQDAGVDVRDKYLTRIVVAEEYDYYSKINKVVYEEKEPVLGEFDRVEEVAKMVGKNKWFFSFSTTGHRIEKLKE